MEFNKFCVQKQKFINYSQSTDVGLWLSPINRPRACQMAPYPHLVYRGPGQNKCTIYGTTPL